jgi:hypothetical protein
MENADLKRYKGQYIKDDVKVKKHKATGNELQHINLCTYSHNGKLSKHGGAL